MKLVGLNPDSKKRVRTYFMGMKQGLAIGQAVMENPDILILDERMNDLESEGVRDIQELLLILKAIGKTMLIASHYKEDIDILCNKVYEMQNGCLTEALG